MSQTLIICEKPSAAKTISKALSDGNVDTHTSSEGVKWFEFVRDNKRFFCAPAVGHLFSLKQKSKGWDYPKFDVEWVPAYSANRSAAFSEKYFKVLEEVSENVDDVIIATDFDEEGELIGVNILKNICNKSKALRMKFSTMTDEELIDSYNHADANYDKNLVDAGTARHMMDWFFGVNMTRALTLAIKKEAKRFKMLSTGRVQGPVLHMLAKHERKIMKFNPKPFWQLSLTVQVGKEKMDAEYEKDKIWDEKEAEKIMKESDSKIAKVTDISERTYAQKPPIPYNTSSFLTDAYRYFGYSPKKALGIAETLYQRGYISYPRTNSEELPEKIGYESILKKLRNQSAYKKDCDYLLAKKSLKPMKGKRKDSAHPALFPTGKNPSKVGGNQKNIYDLITRRFLATFGEPSERISMKIEIDAKGNKYLLKGKRTLTEGWTKLYGKYSKRDEIILPELSKGDEIEIKKVNKMDKETQPPQRYSQGSVIKEMQERDLGTKATRAQILDTLYNRGYLRGNSIEVTRLGLDVDKIISKNVPDLISEELTRKFEDETELIRDGKIGKEKVIDDVKNAIKKISEDFRKRESKIGKELTKAVIEMQEKRSIIGPCRECKDGILKVHKSWRTGKRFVGCSNFANKKCDFGAPLPKEGEINATGKICEKCNTPIIEVRRAGKRSFRMCVDPECETKEEWLDKKKLENVKKKSIKSSKEAKKNQCPECGRYFSTRRGMNIHISQSHKK